MFLEHPPEEQQQTPDVSNNVFDGQRFKFYFLPVFFHFYFIAFLFLPSRSSLSLPFANPFLYSPSRFIFFKFYFIRFHSFLFAFWKYFLLLLFTFSCHCISLFFLLLLLLSISFSLTFLSLSLSSPFVERSFEDANLVGKKTQK